MNIQATIPSTLSITPFIPDLSKVDSPLPGSQPSLHLPNASTELPHRDLLTPWQLQRVFQFIESHLVSTVRIEDLAAQAKLSQSYFAKAFRVTVGETPYAYVLRKRMEFAKKLIVDTDLCLAHVALACGMTDQAHLCKTFQNVFAVTPNRWRRAQRIIANMPMTVTDVHEIAVPRASL